MDFLNKKDATPVFEDSKNKRSIKWQFVLTDTNVCLNSTWLKIAQNQQISSDPTEGVEKKKKLVRPDMKDCTKAKNRNLQANNFQIDERWTGC